MTSALSDARPAPPPAVRATGVWLLSCVAMTLAMTVIGALTRLTDSGLSMVEWRPLLGWLPPLTEGEWRRVFALYQQTSQHQLMNLGMTLPEFRAIFWWEYIHRLWGRLLGALFILPLAWLMISRRLPSGYGRPLLILLGLGAAQAVIGWWMVTSGFSGRTEVSQYRLALHLGIAFLILGGLFWLSLRLLWPVAPHCPPAPQALRRLACAISGALFLTVLAGALTAGMNAGLLYNDWPFMGGQFAPEGYLSLTPWWLNAFETPQAVQFHHRLLAYGDVALIATLWALGRRAALTRRARWAIGGLTLLALLQLGLGVATLMAMVPIALAALHQGVAALLFLASIWSIHELRGGGEAI